MEAAISYAMTVCTNKEACQLLVSGCESRLSSAAEKLCDTKQYKVIAAPMISEEDYQLMASLCAQQGICLIHKGLRDHLAGIDMGFTIADYGIAETGKPVLLAYCLASIVWMMWGYSLAFGPSVAGLFGGLDHFFMAGIEQVYAGGESRFDQDRGPDTWTSSAIAPERSGFFEKKTRR